MFHLLPLFVFLCNIQVCLLKAWIISHTHLFTSLVLKHYPCHTLLAFTDWRCGIPNVYFILYIFCPIHSWWSYCSKSKQTFGLISFSKNQHKYNLRNMFCLNSTVDFVIPVLSMSTSDLIISSTVYAEFENCYKRNQADLFLIFLIIMAQQLFSEELFDLGHTLCTLRLYPQISMTDRQWQYELVLLFYQYETSAIVLLRHAAYSKRCHAKSNNKVSEFRLCPVSGLGLKGWDHTYCNM